MHIETIESAAKVIRNPLATLAGRFAEYRAGALSTDS
jgi:hypothetical protein